MKYLALAALLLVGCATEPSWVWEHRENTAERWHSDNGQCRAQAFGVANVTLMQAAIVHDSCLQGKGWYKQSVRR